MKSSLIIALLAVLILSSCKKENNNPVSVRTGLASLTNPNADSYLVFIESATNIPDTVILQNTSGDGLSPFAEQYADNGSTYQSVGFTYYPKKVKQFKQIELYIARTVANGTPYNKCALPSQVISPGQQNLSSLIGWSIIDVNDILSTTGPNLSKPPFEITSVTTIPAKNGGCDTTRVCGKLSNMAFENPGCPIWPYYFSEAVFQVNLVAN